MNIEVLISTMFNDDYKSLIKRMNIKNNVIIINQGDRVYKEDGQIGNFNFKIYGNTDRGLSKSRNMAIEKSSADICVISDDDFIYNNDAFDNIIATYKNMPDADIILFKYTSNRRKKFPKKVKRINLINSMRACSAQITFRRSNIQNIRFNVNFGTGSNRYTSGEENIFLAECLRRGLKIYYVPIDILTLAEERDSTWFKGYNELYFKSKGACFYKISSKYFLFLILQFALRKYKLYSKELKLRDAIKYMLQGKEDIKRNEEVNE